MISKATVEGHLQLCVFSLRRENMLREGYATNWVWRDAQTLEETGRIGVRVGGSALHLSYRMRWADGEWEDVSDTIPLSHTRPAKGGLRWWLVCPGCGSRRAKLYLRTYFRCRGCLRLPYASQCEQPHSRALRRFFKRRRGLGGFGGTYEPFPAKPKWMRWATYQRLYEQDARDLARIDAHSAWLMERLGGRF